jgi:predicted nucleic acid-binding protein
MTIGEGSRVMVDTNILIYANSANVQFNKEARKTLLKLLQNNYVLCISRQIIREFLVYATRYNFENEKVDSKIIINRIFENLEQYHIVNENDKVTYNLKHLIDDYNLSGKKIHDANIVATMQAYNITKLLTHNIKDFERFNNIIEIIQLEE